ncbi:DMT family transporter [Mesobacterium pallidum]|uniref:DMT family transporter n=1 Tax=Mesobacterium pallidum TaxID=2872037 RepID=UPI001EE1C751|nr:DMT family transporter [Mesobacterium pallidum]
MERKDRIDAAGAALLIGFTLLLGGNQVVVKITNGGFPPVSQAALRSVLAVLALTAWLRYRGIPFRLPRPAIRPAILLGVFFAVEFLTLFLALDMTTVARASIVFYSMPVWLTLTAHVLIPGEHLTRARIAGLVLAMAGVVWALFDPSRPGEASLLGDLLALVSALCWMGIALTARVSEARLLKPEQQLFWQVAISAPLLLVAAPLFGPWATDPQLIHVGGLLFGAVIVVAFGFAMWFWLLSVYPASGVASFSFLSPVFAALLGWLVLDEPLGPRLIGALALVAVGLILINRPARHRH